MGLMRPTCARLLAALPNNYKTNSCAANNCASFKPMNDPDTNPTQDTEHHLRETELLAKVLPAGGPLLDGFDERDYADENAALAAGRLQATGGGAA